MQAAPLPPDESERLAALAALAILDTETEPAYDAIVQLASAICGTPAANVTMIDRDRQWHKASINAPAKEESRDIAFCAHTILRDEPLVVEDARTDDRFHDNPYVTGAPHIRFYAGQRLVTPSGHAVGTLCVIDHHPRQLTQTQLDALTALARQTSMLLELRLRSRELEREVEQRRRAEAEAKDALSQADAANAAKSLFLSHMSHELRTPLTALIGFTKFLLRNQHGTLNNTDLRYATQIDKNATHLLRLINELLDLAKVESGKMTIEHEPVALDTMVTEALAGLEGQVLDRPVALRSELPTSLSLMTSDHAKLKQIVINLVGNAIKFTERGHVLVRVEADPASGCPLALTVEDTGPGIPADRLETIFNPFDQGDVKVAKTHVGTGLGLTISKAFADLLRYRLSVTSTVGVGTTFRLAFQA